ncbi:unnamed protein product [marine sediment metagenome]|uniref:Uncharacterized protein n=1 Tax=marine sediment metagenome TaxID=412755 RepID=X1TP86_9ZZZZ
MKCPMLQRYLIQGENEALEVFDDCLKEECAWWDEEKHRCAVLGIYKMIYAVHRRLVSIGEK